MEDLSSKEMVPKEGWEGEEIKIMNDDCDVAMTFLDDYPIVSQKYKNCLQRGRAAIIAAIMKIMDQGYFMRQPDSQERLLYWRVAPQWLAGFLLDLEVVFTGDDEFKIRKKELDTPAIEEATSAAANASLQRSTACWEKREIKDLYDYCQDAMRLFIDGDTRKISEIYRQCLGRGRDAIIGNIMEFIMNSGYFKKQYGSSEYVLYWRDAPQGLARFLQRLETVFTGGEEVKIRKKRAGPVAVGAVAAAKAIISSLALSASYDVLKEGLTSLYEKEHANPPAPIAILVAFVEAPDPRQKSGVLRTYEKMRFGNPGASDEEVEFLKGKRLLNEKWAEEGQHYDLSGDTNAVLCMHLWSLMKYAGFSDSVKIWKAISNGWPECVSWKSGIHGQFWDILPKTKLEDWGVGESVSNELPLWKAAEEHGLESMLDAYNDMEMHFNKPDGPEVLKKWTTAYAPQKAS